jgi:sphinganine-1-phosphate aldolase
MGSNALYGIQVRVQQLFLQLSTDSAHSRGYLESCRSIVTCAREVADIITSSIPELYILGSPPASVVGFASKDPKVNMMEVGDVMSQRGWHLNALTGPPALHLACTVRSM